MTDDPHTRHSCWENIRPQLGPALSGGFISWRPGELEESWKVNVNVIVVEAPHGWVRGPPVVETGYIPLSSIQVVYEDCTNPHQGRTLPCHHSTLHSASPNSSDQAGPPGPPHLTSPHFNLNKQHLADWGRVSAIELSLALLPPQTAQLQLY